MKRRSVTMWATVTAIVLALTMSGCGDSTGGGTEPAETSPGDVAMLYVDAFRGDADGLTDYNPDSSWDGSYFESVGESATGVVGQPLDDEQATQVAAAYKEALGRVKAEVTDEKVDGDKATVTLAMRGLAYGDAMEAAAADFVLDKADPTGSYTGLLLETLDGVQPVAEPMDVTMTFTRTGDLWVPDSESGTAIIKALMR